MASGTAWLLSFVFGRWRWEAPAWMPWIGGQAVKSRAWAAANPKRTAAAGAAFLAALAGLVWYLRLPKPEYVEYSVIAPPLTTYDEKGVQTIHPLLIHFSESAAPLQQVEKRITTGIEMSPAIAGVWFWTNDQELQFTPKSDWPVDGHFTLRLARRGLLAPAVELEDYKTKFDSQPFAAKISSNEFYQDPSDPNLKKLVATVTFSHPVDPTQFEKRISLIFAKDAQYLGLNPNQAAPDGRNFTVVYDKLRLAAHIHSAALGMPRDDSPLTLRIDSGIRAARGGNETESKLESMIVIPGRSSLRFSGGTMTLVDNARYEPEQVLLLNSSSPVAEQALNGNVQVYLLPVHHPRQKPKEKPYHWDNPEEIGSDILAKSELLKTSYVASDGGSETTHGFKFLAPVGRYLYVLAKDGVQGIGGYVSGKPYVTTLRVQPYHQALTFLGQGSLLSMSGDKRIGFLVRDVDQVEVGVGRVLPNQLQHLAPLMWDYSKPYVGGIEDSIVERFDTVRDYRDKQPGKPTYDNIDLGQYLLDKTQTRRGLFLLHVRSVPGNRKRSSNDEDGEDTEGDTEGNPYSDGPRIIEDSRLVLITDLGLIVKLANDGTRDVFVQSIRSGDPVGGARVDVLGTNGQPVASATTDAGGHVQLPRLENLRRDKNPLMVIVQKDADYSFMPLRGNRSLDMSRFDTGGIVNATSAQQLSAYLFTDRGIYRPGETTHLGLISRTADWQASLAGLPLTIEISDPRGLVINRTPVKLTQSAFEEITWSSETSSPTGIYQAAAYVIKENNRRDLLGSTTFKVQEFEPDRLKVRLDMTDKPGKAWLTPAEVKATVTVAHLFGEPAGKSRVEGEMNLTPVLPSFAPFPDYRFQIGEVIKEPFHESLPTATTDDKGMAEFRLDLGRFTGRAYRLNILARAFEAEGGRNVAAQNSAVVSAAPFLVGVKKDGDLDFVTRGSSRQAHWIAVNSQLTPVAADNLSLEWIQRKYVSVLTQQDNQTYKYVSQLKEIVRDTKKVRIAAGGTNFALPTQEPGDFILLLRDSSGTELNRLAYSVAGQANISRSLERNAELQVQLDKPGYAGGETIQVSIRAPYVGSGLITIEREKVFHYQWFHTNTTSTVQKIVLPKTFEGNGYVNVQFLRDPSSDELFLSPLSYGVAPFAANLAVRTQQVRLTAARQVKPGTTLNIHVAPAEPSRVIVFAVDEGILQVARYKNPDPLGYFFQKKMLQVDTAQILDLILPEFRRFMALAAPGGDADGGFSRHLNPFNKKHKPPVAWWSGLMDVGPAGRELHYTVPDYFNGKLRIVAIAVSPKKVGVSQADTEVKGDFILSPNVPAMASPGDEFTVSVGVFNSTSDGKTPIVVTGEVSRELAPSSPSRMEVQVASKNEGVAEFRFKANPILGASSLKFTARRGASEARIEESIGIRPAVEYRSVLKVGRFDGAQTEASLTRDLYSEKRTVEASVSNVPLVWGQALSAWLDAYPYPCTEQLVSKGFAALMLASRPEFGSVRSRDPQPLAGTLSMLQDRENDQGGFGLWSSSPQTAEFPTVYAAQFLLESKDRGQKVPPEMLASVNEWLNRFASTPANSLAAARLRAYAVYLLVRQGIRPVAALSNVEQELSQRYPKTWTTDLAAAYLASTYRLMQKNADADRILKSVPWASTKRDWNSAPDDFYYGPVVHDAQLLYLVARHFPNRLGDVPSAALEGIGKAISGNQISSLSAAYTLLALDAFAKTAAPGNKFGVIAIGKDGHEQTLTLSPGALPKASVPEATARVRFSKSGPLAAYYSINESGYDRNPPVEETRQGVEIIHEFLDANGNPVSQVKVGQEFLIRLRIRSTQRDVVQQVAVVDLLPGGVEPRLELAPPADTANAGVDPAVMRGAAGVSSLPIGIPAKSTWAPQHVDVRDDRIVLYGDIARTVSTFVYRVSATNPGVYQTPPAFAEGMYDRSVSGIGLGGKLEIVKP